ncbi:MAG TPA: hypothetical protein VFX76_19470, partial [Roseiflexaceae bacterium]|nr:hypothetical protein [Roseiflexaceae bacterium]
AREILLGGRRRSRPRPNRPESRAERDARHHQPRVRSSGGAGLARVSAAIQTAGSDSLKRNERTVGATIGGLLLAVSVLSARFPRALAWPLALLGALFGGISLIRAANPDDDPDD